MHLLLQNCDILQPILQLSLLCLWQHVLEIILHTVGCLCPKIMWSFLLCSCITPAPTSDHFLTKVLSCWHHKNLTTESLFQSEIYVQILLIWPWEYLVKQGIIVPIRAILHINFLHHIENKDRTKCQPTRQHHTTNSFMAASPLCTMSENESTRMKHKKHASL
jgi:hypothetical protein